MDDSFSIDEWNTEVESAAESIGFDVEKEYDALLKLSGEDWFRVEEVFNSISEINQKYTYCKMVGDRLHVSCPPSETFEEQFISDEYRFPVQRCFEECSETDMYEPFEFDIVDEVLEIHTNVNYFSEDSEGLLLDHILAHRTMPLCLYNLGYSESEEYEFVYRFLIESSNIESIPYGFIQQLIKADKLWLDCPVCGEEKSVKRSGEVTQRFVCHDCWTPIPYVESVHNRLDECYDVSEIRSKLDKLLQEGVEVDDDSYFDIPVPDESMIDYKNVKLYDIRDQSSDPFLAVVDGYGFRYELNSDEPFILVDFDEDGGDCTLCGSKEGLNQRISGGLVGEWGVKITTPIVCDSCLEPREAAVEEAISNCHSEVATHLL